MIPCVMQSVMTAILQSRKKNCRSAITAENAYKTISTMKSMVTKSAKDVWTKTSKGRWNYDPMGN